MLDEATANVDVETDALVQRTVSQEFASCTLLAVAHRLHTVVASDAILVMDAGRAAEYGAPASLVAKQDGIFSSMVDETGPSTAQFLRSVAMGDAAALQEAQRQAAAALERMQATAATCDELRDQSQELLSKAASARNVLISLLRRLREARHAASTAEALGMADTTSFMMGGDADDGGAHTRALLAQAVEAVADIELLAEAAARGVARGGEGAVQGVAVNPVIPRRQSVPHAPTRYGYQNHHARCGA